MDLPSGGGSVAAAAQAHGINRQDVQAAIVKAAELRALHAALLQGGAGGSPAAVRLPTGASPSVSRGASQFTVPEDYPVFTPVSSCCSSDSAFAPLLLAKFWFFCRLYRSPVRKVAFCYMLS